MTAELEQQIEQILTEYESVSGATISKLRFNRVNDKCNIVIEV